MPCAMQAEARFSPAQSERRKPPKSATSMLQSEPISWRTEKTRRRGAAVAPISVSVWTDDGRDRA